MSLPGPDGRARCDWAVGTGVGAELYLDYHDHEWGRPVRDAVGLYERLTLEAFQSGLSWLTILRKRGNFRAAFAGFAPHVVARFGDVDVDRLLADPGIVRNRAKIAAAIINAAAVEATPDLADLIWSYADPSRPAPRSLADVPASTAASAALAKDLKRRGFVFVGPTTAYALMQAIGVVDDHLADCIARGSAG